MLKRIAKAILKRIWELFLWLKIYTAYIFFGIEGVNPIFFHSDRLYNPRILRTFGAKIGKSNVIHSPLIIHLPLAANRAVRHYSNLKIGDGCHIGRDVFLDLRKPIEIGDKATISMRTSILTHTDVGRSPLKPKYIQETEAPVKIKSGAYIGAGVIILQGVEIGECAVVGAGAVVTKSIPPFTVVAGVPARVIKKFKE